MKQKIKFAFAGAATAAMLTSSASAQTPVPDQTYRADPAHTIASADPEWGTSIASLPLPGGGCDYLVGSPFQSQAGLSTGEVTRISGATGASVYAGPVLGPAPIICTNPGQTPTIVSGFGRQIGTGDFNGDGVIDFAVSAPTFVPNVGNPCGQSNPFLAGRIAVFDGVVSSAPAAAPTPALTVEGSQFGDMAGRVMAGVGDVNGDGLDDLAYSEGLFVVILSGSSSLSAMTTGAPLLISNASDIAALGDVNGDGYDDFAVGTSAGAAYVVLGGVGVTLPIQVQGNGATFGMSVAPFGPGNSDGDTDLAVGVPVGAGMSGTGEVRILSMSSILAGGAPVVLRTLTGRNGPFGETVQGGQDVDGDGSNDLAAMGTDSIGNRYVRVFSAFINDSGDPLYDITTNIMSQVGPLGFELIGDTNADGNSEVIVAGQSSTQMVWGGPVAANRVFSADCGPAPAFPTSLSVSSAQPENPLGLWVPGISGAAGSISFGTGFLQPGTVGYLFFGGVPATPAQLSGCSLWLAGAQYLEPIVAPAGGGAWGGASYAPPAGPALLGLTVNYQAVMFVPGQPVHLSNAVSMTPGWAPF